MNPTTPRPRPIALRVELQGVAPLVWRRILASNQWTLASLYNYLQWVMGWNDTHAHQYHVGTGMVAPAWWIEEVGTDRDATQWRDERRVSVAAVVAEVGADGSFDYRYYMGDDWHLRIVVEPMPARMAADIPLLRCIAGENACPPDDVGGPHGYELLLEAMADRDHEQHDDMVRWIGGVFDPKGFDLNRLNREWKGTKSRRR